MKAYNPRRLNRSVFNHGVYLRRIKRTETGPSEVFKNAATLSQAAGQMEGVAIPSGGRGGVGANPSCRQGRIAERLKRMPDPSTGIRTADGAASTPNSSCSQGSRLKVTPDPWSAKRSEAGAAVVAKVG
jgi:hypothetical protein